LMVLLLLSSVAEARSVQTVDSEKQLASILCRNPRNEATNELLLDRRTPLVNVSLWGALVACASSAQDQGLPAKSIEIYKIALRVADRLEKPELIAATYYHIGRTYSVMSDLDNAILAYETSRKLFEQAGIESNLVYVLADLGKLYFNVEDYEKAQSYSEQSLAIAGPIKFSPTNESLGR